MRKAAISCLLAVVFLVCSVFIYSKNTIGSANGSVDNTISHNADLSFTVLSDVHGDTEKLKSALNDLHDINSKIDAIIFNGDTVDQGSEKQYAVMTSFLHKNSGLLPKYIIKNIGNHEFYDYKTKTNSNKDVENLIERYLDFSGEKSVYHDKWIKGYHFISLGSEESNTKKIGSVKASISETQLKWLEDKLAEKYEKGKPIFVFLHQHIDNSMNGWVGVIERDKIKEILTKYPEAVIFTSHTHLSLKTKNMTTDLPYTIEHTGAVHYTYENTDKGWKRNLEDNQGLYVEVNGNKVVVNGRDFENSSWIFSKEISKK